MTVALRRDAAANRQRLLDAARELLAEQGHAVSLNQVAHRAGVGVGTAYRRFASMRALMEALFVTAVDELEACARAALDEPDVWQGIVGFIDRSLELQFGDRGMQVIMSSPHLTDEQVAQARTRVAPLLDELVTRAKRQGVVRADLEQIDLIFLQTGLGAIRTLTQGIEPELYRRYLAVFLDGVRTDREFSPLPVGALDSTRTHASVTWSRRETEHG